MANYLDYEGLKYLMDYIQTYKIRIKWDSDKTGSEGISISKIDPQNNWGKGEFYGGTTEHEFVVEYPLPGPGDYNITSGNVSKTVTITPEKHLGKVFEYELVGHGYTEWLRSIGESDNYSSLTDLLNDEKMIRKLITCHASVDYLIEWLSNDNSDLNTVIKNYNVAKWINLRDYAFDKLYSVSIIKTAMDAYGYYGYGEITKDSNGNISFVGNIPKMSSNSTPFGVATQSSAYTTFLAYQAFIPIYQGITEHWAAVNTTQNQWIGYQFINPVCVRKFSTYVKTIGDNQRIKDIKILASNDNWATSVELYTGTVPKYTSEQYFTANFNNDNYYCYYRINVVNGYNTNGNNELYAVQLYGRELKVNVPKMTSNTAPYGEAFGTTDAYLAFNGTTSNYSRPSSDPKTTISYDFKKSMICKSIMLYTYASENRINTFQVYGSNDKTNWYKLKDSNFVTNQHYYPIDNDIAYRYYAITAQHPTGAIISMTNFYGLDYSEREFESGSKIKFIYDHGVELETISTVNSRGVSTTTFEKRNDCLYYKRTEFGYHGYFVNNNLSLNYKNIFVRWGNILSGYGNNQYGYVALHNSSTFQDSTRISGSELTGTTLDKINSNNISSYANGYVAVYDTTGGNYTSERSITEWWLE